MLEERRQGRQGRTLGSELSMNLRDFIAYIDHHYEHIPIRAEKDGKWGSFYLHELTDEKVARWMIDKLVDGMANGEFAQLYRIVATGENG